MMTVKEIFEAFQKIDCCTFATIDGDYPETRIAHFLVQDEEGIYFMTMNTKPFHRQLKKTGKLSVCGLYAKTQTQGETDKGYVFEPGYFIRVTGDVREVGIDEIKAKHNPDFRYCIEDNARYPAMTAFVLYRGRGEIFDYDFEREKRDHKLERERFAFGGMEFEKPGLTITDQCIGCGKCTKTCSYDAIVKDGNKYKINGRRCDECGNCVVNCPVGAVKHKGI